MRLVRMNLHICSVSYRLPINDLLFHCICIFMFCCIFVICLLFMYVLLCILLCMCVCVFYYILFDIILMHGGLIKSY